MKQNLRRSESIAYQSQNIGVQKPAYRRGFSGKSVGALVSRLTRPAFEKFGFPAAAIVTDWPAIVGPELAGYTLPERLRWPRGRQHMTGQTFRDDSNSGPERGATLILRVDGPRAIEVQFMAGQIIERINVYFGYRAVSELRILQAPLTRAKEASRPQKTSEQSRPIAPLPPMENQALRQALERLAANIGSTKRRTS
ncbi:MAG: DUF721 domain-containing protein [Methyloligellaceae bacterium]